MCLVALAFRMLPDGASLIAANRDEFHARATLPLHVWPDSPEVIAGRDAQAGGTWMGMTPSGRFAFVTNYRDPGCQRADARSRGDLVAHYLQSMTPADRYIAEIAAGGEHYNGFNLIVGTPQQAWYYSNRGAGPRALHAGIYLLSNHLLDSPWPKAQRVRHAFEALISRVRDGGAAWDDATQDESAQASVHSEESAINGAPDALRMRVDKITRMMRDTTPAPDADLPSTGLPLARERLLSSPFIVSPDYGTRSTAVMSVGGARAPWMSETRYGPDGQPLGTTLLDVPCRPAHE